MFLYNKKWLYSILTALFLPAAAVTVNASANTGICGPGEYILLSTGNNYADIVDQKGKIIGNCRTNMMFSTCAAIVKKNSLVLFSNEQYWTVYSMDLLKTVLEFPFSEYDVNCTEQACIAMNRSTGSYRIYDCSGRLLYESQDVIPTDSGISYGQIYTTDNGYIAGVCGYDENEPVSPCAPVWISKDMSTYRTITDPMLSRAFFEGLVSPFGSYFSIYNWEKGTCNLYDINGNSVLENVETLIYPYAHSPYSLCYYTNPVLALVRRDDTYLAYDTDLFLTASFPATGVIWPEYADGYICGMRYGELDDEVCSEFVLYRNEVWCPSARTSEGLLVYQNGKQQLLPVSTGENVSGFNDDFYIAAGDDLTADGGHYEKLIDRKTGNVITESRWTEEHYICFELSGACCLATEYQYTGNDYESFCTLYDPDGSVIYQSDKSDIHTWKNGYIYLKRGIYHGIADVHGNWLARTVAVQEE